MTNLPASPRADLLKTIVAGTRKIVDVRANRESLSALARRAERCATDPGRFCRSLARPGQWHVIAECKQRSPSRGILRRPYDPGAISAGYQTAGATAISVLTEPMFFDGSLEHLVSVRAAVHLPILRKDFIITEYQLLEARAAGADAVLLIVAALEPVALRALIQRAASLDLDVLVEVHDSAELDVAIDAGAPVIGVNNRDLKTLTVNMQTSETLVARIPAGVVSVSESGLRAPADLLRCARLGFDAFLIGERFMTEPNPGVALSDLLRSLPIPVSGRDGSVPGVSPGR